MKHWIAAALLALPAAASAWPQSWWNRADKVCEQVLESAAQSQGFVYPKIGHFDTTSLVARIAGFSDREAAVLACYSQLPDADAWRLAAVPVAIWGVVNLPYRHLIMNDLHSLHGGDARAVATRRAALAARLRDGLRRKEESWKLGFIIHALGDSYAHVKGRGKALRAYGELVGHGFAFIEKPDDIPHDDNITHYREFVQSLYAALEQQHAQPAVLAAFLERVQIAAATESKAAVTEAIRGVEVAGQDEERYLRREAPRHIRSSDVKTFLRELDTDLGRAAGAHDGRPAAQ